MKRSACNSIDELDNFKYIPVSSPLKKYKIQTIQFSDFWKNVITSVPSTYANQLETIDRKHGIIGITATTSIPKLVEKFTEEYPDHVVCVQNGDFYSFFGLHALAAFKACGLNASGGRALAGVPVASASRFFERFVSCQYRLCVVTQQTSDKTGKTDRKLVQIISPANPKYFFTDEKDTSTIDNKVVYPRPVLTYSKGVMTVIDMQAGSVCYSCRVDSDTLVSTCHSLQAFQLFIAKDRNVFRNLEQKLEKFLIVSFVNNKYVVEEAFRLHFVTPIETGVEVVAKDNHRKPLTHYVAKKLGLIYNNDKSIPSLSKAMLGKSSRAIKAIFNKWLVANVCEKSSYAMQKVVKDLMTGSIQVMNGDVLYNDSEILAVMNHEKLHKNSKMFFYLIDVVLNNDRHIDHKCLRWCAENMVGGRTSDYDWQYENDFCGHWCTFAKNVCRNDTDETLGYSSQIIQNMVKDLSQFRLLQWYDPVEVEHCLVQVQKATNELTAKGKKVTYNDVDQVIQLEYKQAFGNLIPVVSTKGKVRNFKFTTSSLDSAINLFKSIIDNQKKYEQIWVSKFCKNLLEKNQRIIRVRVNELLLKSMVHTMTEKSVNSGFFPRHLLQSNGCDQLFPYWLPIPDERVANRIDIKLNNTTIITAPNMAGKSTTLRSILAAAVLHNAGFCVPAESFSGFPHFDNFFVRFPAMDDPIENISSFEAEVIDVADILKNSTTNSLVLLDEIGRGTSYDESKNYTNALINELKGTTTLFATHLFVLLDLQYHAPRFTLTDYRVVNGGECRDSRAIQVLRKHNIPESICTAVMGTNTSPRLHLQHINPFDSTLILLKQMVGYDVDIKIFEHNVMVPPGLALNSPAAIYILDEHDGKIYIGESCNVLRRRKEHAGRNPNRKDCKIAVAMLKGGKTESMQIESKLQRACIKTGIPLSSTYDSHHI